MKDEKAAERVADLPKEVRVLYWKRSYPATDEEYVCHDQFIKSESEEVPEMLKDFYSRELRRVIGMSHFDYAVVLTKMKRFFPIMSGSLDVKKIYTNRKLGRNSETVKNKVCKGSLAYPAGCFCVKTESGTMDLLVCAARIRNQRER